MKTTSTCARVTVVTALTLTAWGAGPMAANAVEKPLLFGVNTSTFDSSPRRYAQDFQRAGAVGARAARIGIDGSLDRGGGRLDYSTIDFALRRLHRFGIEPIGVLGGFRSACRSRRSTDPLACAPTPGTYRAYARLVRKLVAHYRGTIRIWESWNEPEQREYFGPDLTPAHFAKVLRTQYRAVKRADPDAQLLFAATGTTQFGYVSRALAALDGRQAFDGYALHPYRFPPDASPEAQVPFVLADGSTTTLTLKEELLAVATLFQGYGYGQPDAYITEIGWSARDETGGRNRVTLVEQAQYLEQIYTMVRDDPELDFVKSIMWFNIRDYNPGETPKGERIFTHDGLFTFDGKPKPAADAFRSLAGG